MAITSQFNIRIGGVDQVVNLNQLLGSTSSSLDDLRTRQQALEEAFSQASFGTQEFRNLQSALRDVNTQIKVLDEATSDLTIAEKFEGIARIGSAVGASFALAAQGATLFGEENSKTAEEIAKAEQRLLFFISALQTLQIVTEAFSSKNKIFLALINSISTAFGVAATSATSFARISRIALASTGIGLFVVLLGSIASNIDVITGKFTTFFKQNKQFFDNLRDVFSKLSGGLIDDSFTNNLNKQIEKSSKELQRKNELFAIEFQKLNNRPLVGLSTEIDVINEKLSLLYKNIADNNQALQQNISDSSDILSVELTKLVSKLEKQSQSFLDLFTPSTNGNIIDYITGFFGDKVDTDNIQKLQKEYQFFINELTDPNVINKENTLSNISNRLKLLEKELTQLGLSVPDQLKTVITTVDEFIQKTITSTGDAVKLEFEKIDKEAEKLKRNLELRSLGLDIKDKDISNLNKIINAIISFGNAAGDAIGDKNVIKQLNDEVARLGSTITDPALIKAFNEIQKKLTVLFNPNKITNNKLINKDLLIEELRNIETIQIAAITKRKQLLDSELVIDKKREEKRKRNALIGLNPNEIKAVEDDFNKNISKLSKNVTLKKKELDSQIEDIKKRTNEGVNLINLTSANLGFKQLETDVNNVLRVLDAYKSGLGLFNSGFKQTVDNLNGQNNPLFFSQMDFDKQIKFLEDISNKRRDLIFKQGEQNKIGKNASEQQAISDQVLVDLNTELLNLEQSIVTIKVTKLELEKQYTDLVKQNNINNLRAELQINKSVKNREEKIKEIYILQSEQIQSNFEAEIKGLEKGDIRYKTAIEKRDQAFKELSRSESEELKNLELERIAKWSEAFQFTSNSIAEIFNIFNQLNQQALIDNQDRLNQIQEQLSFTQENISVLDGLIADRKSRITDLQNAADKAEGGLRDEILSKIESEFKLTQALAKQKFDQAKAQEKILKRQAELQKENNKLQKESTLLQKQQAVAANLLAVAQASVAIATLAASSANKDFTFGIATVASIVALSATLVSTFNSIKALTSSNTEQNLTVPLNGGAKGGFPDGFTPMAVGGFTPKKGLGIDKTGEDNVGVYRLHSNEWVAPRWMVESAKYGSMISELEAARSRGFAVGGSPSPLNQTNNNEQLTQLLVANLNKPIYVAVTDINDGQNRVNVLENRSKL